MKIGDILFFFLFENRTYDNFDICYKIGPVTVSRAGLDPPAAGWPVSASRWGPRTIPISLVIITDAN